MDIIGTQQTPFLVLLNIFMVIWFFFSLKPILNYSGQFSSNQITFTKFLVFVFCIFSFWGPDWFYYIPVFQNLKNLDRTHMEDIYVFISQISPNYIFFRTVIWGSAVLLAINLFKRIEVNSIIALLIFSAIWLIWFSYARVSLAMALMFWGVAIIYKPLFGIKTFSFLVGFAAIFASLYFHKSAAFGIFIIILSLATHLFFQKFDGNFFLFLSIIIILTAFLLLQNFLVDFMLFDNFGEDNLVAQATVSGQRYLDASGGSKGIGAIIAQILERAPYYLTTICCIKAFGKGPFFATIPPSVKIFIYIAFFTTIFSTFFVFGTSLNTTIIFERFMRFAILPCSIVTAYCYEHKETHLEAKCVIFSGIIGVSYQLLYTFYCTL